MLTDYSSAPTLVIAVPETDYSCCQVMLMLGGKLRLTDSDGAVSELSDGDLFFLPKGWSGRWEVIEPICQLYVIISDDSEDVAHGLMPQPDLTL